MVRVDLGLKNDRELQDLGDNTNQATQFVEPQYVINTATLESVKQTLSEVLMSLSRMLDVVSINLASRNTDRTKLQPRDGLFLQRRNTYSHTHKNSSCLELIRMS